MVRQVLPRQKFGVPISALAEITCQESRRGRTVTSPGIDNYHGGMDSLLPRRAKFIRLPDPAGTPRVALVLRDPDGSAPQGKCSLRLRGRVFPVPVEDGTVAAVVVMLQMREEAETRQYAAWVDELAPSGAEVMESLAGQQELCVWFAPPERSGAASTVIPNVLRAFASRHRHTVLEIADSSPWDVHRFAVARSLLVSQFPDAQSLWEELKAGG